MTKHTLSFYIVDKTKNAILQVIFEDKNKIICDIYEVSNLPFKEVSKDFIKQGMAKSRKAFEDGEQDYWVAAVGYMSNLFKEKENTIIFVRNKKNFEVKEEKIRRKSD